MQAGVDAFIIFEDKILLVLRDIIPSIQNPNVWNLPGGGIEQDETDEQALLRELKEEVNLTPTSLQYIDKTSYPDGNVVSKYWIVISKEEKGKLTLGEGQRMQFSHLEEIEKLDIIPNLRSYICSKKDNLKNLLRQSSS